MGEIAEGIIEGVFCEACCGYIGEAVGFPRFCSKACERDAQSAPAAPKATRPGSRKVACPTCGKKVVGLADHQRDAHPKEPQP
jgi:hypothetical protein